MKFGYLLLIALLLASCSSKPEPRYIFFLHNKFVELEGINGVHPDYGRMEYEQIVARFLQKGFIVISDVRAKDANVMQYAERIRHQIDSLLHNGIKPSQITVLGTSKGGYITKIVSSTLANDSINYVLVGCCADNDVIDAPDVLLCGNILSIYESTDSLAQSCQKQKLHSTKSIPHYKEIELHTGAQHGYLYKALSEWIEPAAEWANGHYDNVAKEPTLAVQIDSLLKNNLQLPFNGVIAISSGEGTSLMRCRGYVDSSRKAPVVFNDEFIIGSISKQITSVMVLREYDKGHLKLDVPIRTYLPELTQSWADTITIHQLLTHSHGIRDINGPLAFKPGTQFEYSPLIGYGLLSMIAERTSKKSFPELSQELFLLCKMNGTFHPALGLHRRLVKGMTRDSNGVIHNVETRNSIPDYVGSAGFITTASDMITWNNMLHKGKLLSEDTYKKFIGKYQVRNHPSVGKADYGYGITSIDTAGITQLGHTGASKGFVGMNYYFPQSGTSVVVLENLESEAGIMRSSFFYIGKILSLVRENEIRMRK